MARIVTLIRAPGITPPLVGGARLRSCCGCRGSVAADAGVVSSLFLVPRWVGHSEVEGAVVQVQDEQEVRQRTFVRSTLRPLGETAPDAGWADLTREQRVEDVSPPRRRRKRRLGGIVALAVVGGGVSLSCLFVASRFGGDTLNAFARVPAARQSASVVAAGRTGRQDILDAQSTAPPATAIPPGAAPGVAQATPIPAGAKSLGQEVARTEATLRSGWLEATLDYGSGDRSLTTVIFDRGSANAPARLHMTTTYRGAGGAQTVERISLGEQSWERRAGGTWAAQPTQTNIWQQVQVFLPRVPALSDSALTGGQDAGILQWYDPARNGDVIVHADPASGIPRALTLSNRATRSVLTVTYQGWNTPVEIAAPRAT